MSDSRHATIVYEADQGGWIVASIPEVPGVHSQGRTREAARANVIDALRGMLELRFGQHPSADIRVKIHLEDGSMWATVEDMPGVFATGDTLEELRESLAEGLALYFGVAG